MSKVKFWSPDYGGIGWHKDEINIGEMGWGGAERVKEMLSGLRRKKDLQISWKADWLTNMVSPKPKACLDLKKKNFILFAALQTKIQFYFMRNVSERLPDGKMVGKEKLWHIAPPPSCFPKHPHMLFQVLMAHRIRFWLMLYSSSKFIAIPNIPPSRYLWWQLTFFFNIPMAGCCAVAHAS